MLVKRIIPCLDIRDGRIVKGVEFKDHRDAGDPVTQAKKYAAEGADELVFYDITASSDGRKTMVDLVRRIAKEIFIPFTVGGGIRSVEDMQEILRAGADKISINTAALENPDLINQGAAMLGSQCIVVGIDSLQSNGKDVVYSHTGREETRSMSDWDTIEWVREVEKRGAGEITLNTMNTDGKRQGYDIRLLSEINQFLRIPLVASGGAGKVQDFIKVFQKANVDAALAASVFHFSSLSVAEVKKALHKEGIAVRI